MFVCLYKTALRFDAFGQEVEFWDVANGDDYRIRRNHFTRGEFKPYIGYSFAEAGVAEFCTGGFGFLAFLAEGERRLDVHEENFLGPQAIGFGCGVATDVSGADDERPSCPPLPH